MKATYNLNENHKPNDMRYKQYINRLCTKRRLIFQQSRLTFSRYMLYFLHKQRGLWSEYVRKS